MSHPPTVSVLMAVYNSERYVGLAVESILGQTFSDFELIIIDDGSTDRSGKILQTYAARDNRIHLIQRANRGIARTRNELVACARGEFIAVMDSDDIAMGDRLALQVEFLQQHPEVLCVGGAQDFIDDAGRFLLHHPEPEADADIQKLLLKGHTCINNSSAMMRRSVVLQVGGYDETLLQAEDLDLFLKLGELGKLANLPRTVLLYRQHAKSVSESKHIEHLHCMQIVCEQAWQRRGIQGKFETKPWRPIDRTSRHRYFLQYGWIFFNSGQRQAALIYSLKAIRVWPLGFEGWKLLLCALIKPVKPLSEVEMS